MRAAEFLPESFDHFVLDDGAGLRRESPPRARPPSQTRARDSSAPPSGELSPAQRSSSSSRADLEISAGRSCHRGKCASRERARRKGRAGSSWSRFPFAGVLREGGGGARERFVDIGLGVREAHEPQAALDGAHAVFEQAAPQMRPARRIVAPDVIAVIADRAGRGAGLEHARCGRRGRGPAVAAARRVRARVSRRPRDEPRAEALEAGGMPRAEREDLVEAPAAGGEAERIGVERAGVDDFAADDRLEDLRLARRARRKARRRRWPCRKS